MKEYPEMAGRDIRSVENPYEAAFELAAQLSIYARDTGRWLMVLLGFFVLYICLTVIIIFANIFVFNKTNLLFLGIAMGMANICLGLYTIRSLGRSYRSLRGIHRDSGLMERIDAIEDRKPDGAPTGTGPASGRGVKGLLDRLISETGQESLRLFGTFRFVYLFIVIWMGNALAYFAIQLFRFGLDFSGWKLDWIAPGGTGLDAVVFLVLSIFAYWRVRRRLDFIKTRYNAIGYAMGMSRMPVPPGKDLLGRYRTFLDGKSGPGASGWSTTAYFSAVRAGASGTVLVKAFDGTPDQDTLAEFIRHARAHGSTVSHAIILYTEDPEKPLAEAVYDEVVNNPVRTGRELFTIELVMEGRDGFYDFIPVVSP